MSELPDQIPGEIIFASYQNEQRDRLVQRYLDATQRAIESPIPEVGEVSYLTSTNIFAVYNGIAWVDYAVASRVTRLEQSIYTGFNAADQNFSGTTELSIATLTIPAGFDGDFMLDFNALLYSIASTPTVLRFAARLYKGVGQLEFWDLESAYGDPVNAETMGRSVAINYPIIGAVAGDVYEMRMQQTTTNSPGGVRNSSMLATPYIGGVL